MLPVEAGCAFVLQQAVALHVSDLSSIPVMSEALSSYLLSARQIITDCTGVFRRAWGTLKSLCVKDAFMHHLLSTCNEQAMNLKWTVVLVFPPWFPA